MRSRFLGPLSCVWALGCGGGGGPAGAASDASIEATTDGRVESGVVESGAVEASAGDSSAADAVAPGDAAMPESGADAAGEAGDGGGPTQAIAIPMYMDPTASPAAWSQATAAAPTVALLVANPNSGPGAAQDPQYTQAIATGHAAGQTLVGYVHTSYGARPIAQVEADVDSWYAFYPAIDGIFYDEVSSTASTVASYYQPIHDYVKAKTGGPRTVVINPGTLVPEAFLQAADVVVTFEDTYAHYTDGSYPPNPGWMAGYPRWRFWHLVLSAATAADMQSAVTIARQRNVGYVYVTDKPPATAYSQLLTGAYWQAELAAVRAP